MSEQKGTVELIKVQPAHLEVFFRNQQDTEANDLAKVYPRDRDDFDAHWARIMSNPQVVARSILFGGSVVGNINAFYIDDDMYVGYWIDRGYWGKGIATRALAALIHLVDVRPLIARVAVENIGSIRVLERCGFVKTDEFDSAGDDRFVACVEADYRLE